MLRRFAAQGDAVGLYFVRFRVYFDLWKCVVELHVALGEIAAVADGLDALGEVIAGDHFAIDGGLADEGEGGGAGGAAETGEHWAHDDGMGGGDGGVGV